MWGRLAAAVTAGYRAVAGFNRSPLEAAAVALIVGQVALLVTGISRNVQAPFGDGDWRTYYAVVQLLRAGRGHLIYDVPTLSGHEAALGFSVFLPYPYHPAFLLVAFPFALLPPAASYLAWVTFNAVLLGACMWLLARWFIPKDHRRLFVLSVLLSMPVGLAICVGQSSFFLLLGLSLAARGILIANDWQTALGLALLGLKPQLLPLWIFLLAWQRRWRSLLFLSIAGAGIGVASLLMVGWAGLRSYVEFLVSGVMTFQYPVSFSLMGVAHTMAGDRTAEGLFAVGAGLVFLVWCVCLARLPDSRTPAFLAATVIASLLVANYLLLYDLTLWAVAAALAWSSLKERTRTAALGAWVFIPWSVPIVAASPLGRMAIWLVVSGSLVSFAFLLVCSLRPSVSEA